MTDFLTDMMPAAMSTVHTVQFTFLKGTLTINGSFWLEDYIFK